MKLACTLSNGNVTWTGAGYASAGLRFMLWVQDRDGNELPLIDGGAFDWLARLTSARNVFVASGMGAQLAALRFRGTLR